MTRSLSFLAWVHAASEDSGEITETGRQPPNDGFQVCPNIVSTTTMSQDIPASVSELKEKGNTLFRQRSFAEANEIYQSIIEQHAHDSSVQFIRVLRSNRAACFIELGQYQSALAELDQIFQTPKSDPSTTSLDEQTDTIFSKAHFRKAICLFELGKGAEALHELDTYRDLVNGKVEDGEPHLRAKIQSSIVKSPDQKKKSTTMLPFVYEVRVLVPGEEHILLDCTAPSELFQLNPGPSRQVATAFLSNLATKHDRLVINYKPGGRRCCICSKPATSLTHTPTMYLHLAPEKGGPRVIDLVQPVCKRLGPCDMEARQLIHDELTGGSRAVGSD